MTFWRTFGFQVSEIEALLEKGECEVEDLLDKGEVLVEECKGQNKKLVGFVVQPHVLSKLIAYTIGEPPSEPEEPSENDVGTDDLEEKKRKRANYPHYASEVLCHEDWSISEAIAESNEMQEQLWCFLDNPAPLNPLIATCASKVASVLYQRKTPETFEFLRKRGGMVEKLTNHIGSTPVSELLLKIIQAVNIDSNQHIQWLESEDLLKRILSKFGEGLPNTHENTANVLLELLSSPLKLVSPIISTLESEANLEYLFSLILSTSSSSALFWGLEIVIALLKRPFSYDSDAVPESLPPLLRISVAHLSSFVGILKSMSGPDMRTSFGSVVPLGSHRLKIVEFLTTLVGCRVRWVDLVLVALGGLGVCVQLFFAYHWNNFLHAAVMNMLLPFLEERDPELVASKVFKEAGLLDAICDASQGNEEDLETKKISSRGYMGFLNILSNKIVEISCRSDAISRATSEHSHWKGYVEGALQKQNIAFSVILGGGKPDDSQGGSEEIGIGGGMGGDLSSICSQPAIKTGFSNVFDSGFGYDDDEAEELDLGFMVLSKAFDSILASPYSTSLSDEEEDE